MEDITIPDVSEKQTEVTELPPEALVGQMINGAWVSQVISVVTRLDIPDLLKGCEPMSVDELISVGELDAKPEFLQRLLRACASVGVLTEDEEGRFGATALSNVLTSDAPYSIKKSAELIGTSFWQVWGGLDDAIRTGDSQPKKKLGMDYWDYCKSNPKEMDDFGQAMKMTSYLSQQAVLEKCDLSDVGSLVDVGGGFGHMAISLLSKYKGLFAKVLDLPELAPISKSHLDNEEQVLDRLEFVGGDMFEDVPAANTYIIKHIIHDWDDENCLRLLNNCHRRMDGEGRVICVDAVLTPTGDTEGCADKLLDICMMVLLPGKERTLDQWHALYNAAGFTIESVIPISAQSGTHIITGVKAS